MLIKLTAILIGLSVSAAIAQADDVAPGRKPMVSRKARDVYSVIGEGEVRTIGCTIKATAMEAVVEPGQRPWIWFIDRNGELEAGCEIDRSPVRPIVPVAPRPIMMRQVATI